MRISFTFFFFLFSPRSSNYCIHTTYCFLTLGVCVFVCVISTDYYFTSFCLIKSLSSFIHQNSSLSIKLMKQQVTEVTDVLSLQPWGNVETNDLHVNCTLFLIWQTIIINWWSVGHIWIVKLFCFGVLCLLHSSFTTGPLPCSAQNGSNEYSWNSCCRLTYQFTIHARMAYSALLTEICLFPGTPSSQRRYYS